SSVGIVRAFPRNDTCCQDRFANLRFEVFADDGTGSPGLLLGTIDGPDNAPGGTTAMAEAIFNMSSGIAAGADIVGSLNAAITHIFEIDALTGTMDLIEIANPSPSVYTTYLDLNDATAVVQLINGVPTPGDYKMLSADNILGTFGELILPQMESYGFDTSQLYETGILTITPEPATLSILGLGLLAVRRRRRR
ncbi:PEP-CTERM sorting domain-containing protein, partial [bacterium]|nr:PEP-CTERM sorting domain-containing protein [bacterium]